MVVSLWHVRPDDLGRVDESEIYANVPTMCSLKVFHGGQFIETPGRKYVDEKVDYIDMVDMDEFSVHELDLIIQQLGHPRHDLVYYYYRIPTEDLNLGLRPLGNDRDVLDLSKYVGSYKVISIYTEHGGTLLDRTYFMPNDSMSSVVIEEIDEPGPSAIVQYSQSMQDEIELDEVGPYDNGIDETVNGDVADDVAVHVEDDEVAVDQVNEVEDDVEVTANQVNEVEVVVDNNQDEIDDDPFEGQDEIVGTNQEVRATDGVLEVEATSDIVQQTSQNSIGRDEIFLANFVFPYDEHEDVNVVEDAVVAEAVDEVEDAVEAEIVNEVENVDENEAGNEPENVIVDEENMFEDLPINMEGFRACVDEDRDAVDDDEVDHEVELDDFYSASEDEAVCPLSKAIKKVNKKRRRVKTDEDPSGTIYVGQIIRTKAEVNDLVKTLSVKTHRQLVWRNNDKLRMRLVCFGANPQNVVCNEGQIRDSTKVGESSKAGGSRNSKRSKKGSSTALKVVKKRFPKPTCPFVIHISRKTEQDVWCVKTVKAEHKCLNTRNPRLYTISAIAKEIEHQIEANPTIPTKSLTQLLEQRNQVTLSIHKVHRAKTMAFDKIQGDYTKQYDLLRDYCEELLRSNPGSTCKIEVETDCAPSSETRQFKRIYICIAALKAGFKVCGRDLLGLDGSFLKGPYPGQILTAVGIDSNNDIYPVAYAIVEAETLSSWTWFLECLGEDLELSRNSNFTFISDRQKGIIPALKNVFPAAEHRYCLRHIHENMKSKWRGSILKDMLWKTASQTTVAEFDNCMEEIKGEDEALFNWLKEIPAKHWSRAYFSERANSDVLLNNLCEVFNKQLLMGREKPIITCLEFIREYLMRRISGVHQMIRNAEGPLTPAAAKKFAFSKEKSNQYTVIMVGGRKYQVNGPGMELVAVDLDKRTCFCRKWQITGMPCSHVIACINDLGRFDHDAADAVPEAWVSKVYWLSTWEDVYRHTIQPLTRITRWIPSKCPTKLTPPKHHVQVGRPKKKRKKSANELADGLERNGKMTRKGATITCSNCKKQGHNARTCKGPVAAQ